MLLKSNSLLFFCVLVWVQGSSFQTAALTGLHWRHVHRRFDHLYRRPKCYNPRGLRPKNGPSAWQMSLKWKDCSSPRVHYATLRPIFISSITRCCSDLHEISAKSTYRARGPPSENILGDFVCDFWGYGGWICSSPKSSRIQLDNFFSVTGRWKVLVCLFVKHKSVSSENHTRTWKYEQKKLRNFPPTVPRSYLSHEQGKCKFQQTFIS